MRDIPMFRGRWAERVYTGTQVAVLIAYNKKYTKSGGNLLLDLVIFVHRALPMQDEILFVSANSAVKCLVSILELVLPG